MVSETTFAVSKEIVAAIATIIVAFAVKKLATDTIVNNFSRKVRFSEHDAATMKKILAFLVYFSAFAYILSIFRLQAPLLALLSGAGFAGIVIGFAAKDVIANFIGGMILLVDRPFRIGDIIEIVDVLGKVIDISVRTTIIQTADGEYVTIPNAIIMSSVVKNRSAPDAKYRIRVPVGVDYNTDLKKLNSVVADTIGRLGYALKSPGSELIFRGFGQSSIDFEVAFWVDISKESFVNTKTDAAEKLKQALDKAKIKIPYPHVELIRRN